MKLQMCFVLVILIAIVNVAFGNGNGCAWSGCNYDGGCTTGVTGGSGRSEEHKHNKCGRWGLRGAKHFCCDQDCGYRACGGVDRTTCEVLGENGSWTNEMPVRECLMDIPGFGQVKGNQHFCCGLKQ